MNSKSTLIRARWLIPNPSDGRVLEDYGVLCIDVCIAWIGPWSERAPAPPKAEQVELTGHALCPGFVNSHTHAPMPSPRLDYQPIGVRHIGRISENIEWRGLAHLNAGH